MSDPTHWDRQDWQDFYVEHTSLEPEECAEAAEMIADVVNAAAIGNRSEIYDGVSQTAHGPIPSA